MTTFKMKNEQTGVSIKIDNPDITEEMVVAAFRLAKGNPYPGLTAFRGHPNTPETRSVETKTEPEQKPAPPKMDPIVKKPKRITDELSSRPRQVALIGSENTGSHSLEEVARFKEQPTREHVKVYINCPSCLHEGDRMTRKGGTFSICPQCDMKLFNRYASDIPLEMDGDGYTYLATTEMRFRDRSEE